MKTKMKVGLLDEDYFGLHEKSSLGGEWSSDHWCRICSDKCNWFVKFRLKQEIQVLENSPLLCISRLVKDPSPIGLKNYFRTLLNQVNKGLQ